MHESLLKGKKSKGGSSSAKQKFVPSEETPERRNGRTIFVGNVPVEVVKSRVCLHVDESNMCLTHVCVAPSKAI